MASPTTRQLQGYHGLPCRGARCPGRLLPPRCHIEERTKLEPRNKVIKRTLDAAGEFVPAVAYHEVNFSTKEGVSVQDITSELHAFMETLSQPSGTLTVTSQHTTTGIAINENEGRLIDDIRLWLARLAPPQDMYLHNDLDSREAPDGWVGTWEQWKEQEPKNAHSHLMALLTGSSESIPVVNGQIMLGTWQSVLLLDLDGPRNRKVAMQFSGLTTAAVPP